MNCPNCSTTLIMSERQGIEIDYCPNCRGVWLDRGELDKIIERSASPYGNSSNPFHGNSNPGYNHHGHDKHHDHDRHDYYPHKKKSWLNDIFD